jgi:anti-sigma regulatory factor (Ser/Thr protein kinase)
LVAAVQNGPLAGRTPRVGPLGEPTWLRGAAQLSPWLDPVPGNVAEARRFVAEALAGRGGSLDDCELMVSELATNAVRHGRSMFRVGVHRLGQPIRIEVSDCNSRLPVEGAAGTDAQSGRGLQIVDTLSARWGVRPEAEGKTVWFEL